MAKFVDESEFLNQSVNALEDRLNSQYGRILDTKPTYTVYYNINEVSSTTDTGILDVENYFTDNSPLKFNQIKNFPLYGIDVMALNTEIDEIKGLDINYDSGEAVILPNTIKPFAGDFFFISYLKVKALFQVNNVEFDVLKSNGYYKISFELKYILDDKEEYVKLDRITDERYTCDIKNIGTKDITIIKDDTKLVLDDLDRLITTYKEMFINTFYNKRFNAFLVNNNYSNCNNNIIIYNRLIVKFIQNTNLLYEPREIQTYYINNEDDDVYCNLEYERSFFNYIERLSKYPDDERVKQPEDVSYFLRQIHDPTTLFNYYNKPVKYLRTGIATDYKYISNDLMQWLKEEDKYVGFKSISEKIIYGYIKNKITTTQSLNDLIKECDFNILSMIENSVIGLSYATIILFILKEYKKVFMTST